MSADREMATRRLSQEAVEAALQTIAKLEIIPKAETPLRVLLAYKALWRDADEAGPPNVDGSAVRKVVEELFTVIPGPPDVKGTVSLRESNGKPVWLTNDSARGSFVDYVGPSRTNRVLFEDNDWHNRLKADAVDQVVAKLGSGPKPPRDVLAALALRNAPLDPSSTWPELVDLARKRFGLTEEELHKLTAEPVLGEVSPFGDTEFDPSRLSPELVEAGIYAAEHAQERLEDMPANLAAQVERVLAALRRHGQHSIVALAGVPGTSKSYVARIAARLFADEGCVRELSLSPSYTYEQFMEGPSFVEGGKVEVVPGGFLDFNRRAREHPDKQFVVLLEEMTRADLPRVLGELLTYVEYRGERDRFTTMYRPTCTERVQPNVAILATYNPTDRSAVNLDDALLRRIEPLAFPPSTALLEEILVQNGVDVQVIAKLKAMFEACRVRTTPERFEDEMPFGHAYFSRVYNERDLYDVSAKAPAHARSPSHPCPSTA